MLYDASLVREASTNGAVNCAQQVLTVIGLFIVMARMRHWPGAIVLIGAPFAMHTIRQYSKRTRASGQQRDGRDLGPVHRR